MEQLELFRSLAESQRKPVLFTGTTGKAHESKALSTACFRAYVVVKIYQQIFHLKRECPSKESLWVILFGHGLQGTFSQVQS